MAGKRTRVYAPTASEARAKLNVVIAGERLPTYAELVAMVADLRRELADLRGEQA